MKSTVLCYIEKDNKYLMMYRNKKNNDLNEGKWLGIGGHIEKGETIDQALLREVKEETGLTLLSYKKRGYIRFINDDYEEEMYLFTASSFEGSLIDCVEGELHWIDKDKIFELSLWEGDIYFLKPLINEEEYFSIDLIYSNDKLISYRKY